MAVVSMLMYAFILMNVLTGMGNALTTFGALYNPINIEPSKCPNTFNKEPMLRCGMNSFRNYQPFRYVNGDCQMCPGDQVTNLTFDSVMEFYFPTSHRTMERQVNGSTVVLQLTRPPKASTVIHLAVTPQASSVAFELRNAITRPYHMYLRFASGSLGMDTYFTTGWGSLETFPGTLNQYFGKGRRTDIHFLLTTDRVVIYFDKVFFHEYMYRLPLTEIEQVNIIGDVFVHELTL